MNKLTIGGLAIGASLLAGCGSQPMTTPPPSEDQVIAQKVTSCITSNNNGNVYLTVSCLQALTITDGGPVDGGWRSSLNIDISELNPNGSQSLLQQQIAGIAIYAQTRGQ